MPGPILFPLSDAYGNDGVAGVQLGDPRLISNLGAMPADAIIPPLPYLGSPQESAGPGIIFALRQFALFSVPRGVFPLPFPILRIYGITKDGSNVPIPGCTVHLFRTSDDVEMDQTTSDAVGYYEFRVAISASFPYYCTATLPDSPSTIAGITVNSLIGQ